MARASASRSVDNFISPLMTTIEEINRLLSAKRLINNVAKTFPLASIVAAHEAVESGLVPGKVVVTIG